MHEELPSRVMSVEKLVLASSVASFYAPSSAADLCSPTSDYSRTNSLLTSPSSVDDISDFSTDFDESDSFDRPESSPLPYYIKGRTSLDLSDSAMASAVFCFVKNYVGASGSSTVAIDNKIEQAMDLVKSHLMFAVREEVEVLKEKIAELMERIAFLESENSILRAAASQETLSQLSQIEPPFPPSGGDSNSGSGSGGTQGQNGTSAP